jgi:peptide/nickel transport system permease protein
MPEASESLPISVVSTPRVNELRRIIKVMFGRWVVVFGTAMIVLLVFTAILAPVLATYDPYEQNLRATLQQPNLEHLLGTDELGRDLLSRIIYGSQISLLVGIVTVTIAAVVGMLLGLIAGYYGRWADNVIMRIIDALMALPPMVLMLAIAAVLGGGLKNILIAVGIGMIPTYARLMRGQVISIRETDYILASRSVGAQHLRVMFWHILPNCFAPLIVLITVNLGTAILAEASLSFLGIGITPPTPTWGSMVSLGYKYLLTNPILSIAPGVAIMLIVLSFNLVGDGLRDALDPRLRGIL